jgi:hypothetical protein
MNGLEFINSYMLFYTKIIYKKYLYPHFYIKYFYDPMINGDIKTFQMQLTLIPHDDPILIKPEKKLTFKYWIGFIKTTLIWLLYRLILIPDIMLFSTLISGLYLPFFMFHLVGAYVKYPKIREIWYILPYKIFLSWKLFWINFYNYFKAMWIAFKTHKYQIFTFFAFDNANLAGIYSLVCNERIMYILFSLNEYLPPHIRIYDEKTLYAEFSEYQTAKIIHCKKLLFWIPYNYLLQPTGEMTIYIKEIKEYIKYEEYYNYFKIHLTYNSLVRLRLLVPNLRYILYLYLRDKCPLIRLFTLRRNRVYLKLKVYNTFIFINLFYFYYCLFTLSNFNFNGLKIYLIIIFLLLLYLFFFMRISNYILSINLFKIDFSFIHLLPRNTIFYIKI